MKRKTTSNDINTPFCEERMYKAYDANSQHGRSTMRVICPFCGSHVLAYKWSIRGGGKQCPCGALLGGIGLAFKIKPSMLSQTVFNGAPDWVRWAFVDHNGGGWWSDKKPRLGKSKIDSGECFYYVGDIKAYSIGTFDASEWKNSLIKREYSDDQPVV